VASRCPGYPGHRDGFVLKELRCGPLDVDHGFTGTIRIADSGCVSNGTVTAAADGTTITIGAVQAEEEIDFRGEVAGDHMSGIYSSPAACGNDTGTWEATLSR